MKIKSSMIPYAVLALMLTGVSCKKLDEVNPAGATAEAVWTTPEGMLTLVNASYSELRNFYGKEDAILMTEGGTDIWFNQNKASYANQLTRYENFTAASSGTNRNSFRTFYRVLNLANAGINRIKNVPYPSMDERNRREGELRFVRAFVLWHIVEFYGGANLRTTETKGAELTAKRSSVQDFYNVIIEDLEFAKQHLPLQSSWGAEYSRASKKSAAGLLARVLLTRAYYATGTEATTWFTRARDAAKDVIDRASEFQIALWPRYADLWLPANNRKMSASGGEALFTISNSAANTAINYDANANRMHLWYLTQYNGRIGALQQSLDYGNDGQRRLQPTLALLDMYNENIDSRYEGSFQEVWYANRMVNNAPADYTWTTSDVNTHKKHPSIAGRVIRHGVDTALYITKRSLTNESLRPYVVFDRDTMYTPSGAIAGVNAYPSLIKFAYPNRTAPNAQPGFNDIFLIRFAEMYLIAAEAEFRLGNNTAAASYINVIRTRAAKKAPVNQTAAMQVTAADITIQFILDERAREFAGEQIRWFDLKRSLTPDQWVARIKTLNPDITAVQPFHRLRPIPQEELDALLNRDEFGQNPGY